MSMASFFYDNDCEPTDAMGAWQFTRGKLDGDLAEERDYESLSLSPLSEDSSGGECDYVGDSKEGEGKANVWKFYHGTSCEAALKIGHEGFIESVSGCLGQGIYVARREKAMRFAKDTARHGGEIGGMIEVLVTIKRPKYVNLNDTSWREEGHDACRAAQTSASMNMEWCIKDRSQVEVARLTKVPMQATNKRARQTETSMKPFDNIKVKNTHVVQGASSKNPNAANVLIVRSGLNGSGFRKALVDTQIPSKSRPVQGSTVEA
jgi:hypothetical protein